MTDRLKGLKEEIQQSSPAAVWLKAILYIDLAYSIGFKAGVEETLERMGQTLHTFCDGTGCHRHQAVQAAESLLKELK